MILQLSLTSHLNAYLTRGSKIVIAGVVNAHVAVKFIYVRIFRGTNAMHEKSFISRGTWALICSILWVVSWVIAEAIPVFNDLLGLTVSFMRLMRSHLIFKSHPHQFGNLSSPIGDFIPVHSPARARSMLIFIRVHFSQAGSRLVYLGSFGFISTKAIGSTPGRKFCSLASTC